MSHYSTALHPFAHDKQTRTQHAQMATSWHYTIVGKKGQMQGVGGGGLAQGLGGWLC